MLGEGTGWGVDLAADRIGVPIPVHSLLPMVLDSGGRIGELALGRALPGHKLGRKAGMGVDS